jgi:hypothetical protein
MSPSSQKEFSPQILTLQGGKGTALSVLQLPVNAAEDYCIVLSENFAIYFVHLLTAYVLLSLHPSFSESAVH